MNVLNHLVERGFIDNLTDGSLLATDKLHVPYIGFDLTAPALHVGSLIQLRVLKKFIEAGHSVIVLLGEATTRVGDPSGKDKSRPMLSAEEIQRNRQGIERCIERVISPVEPRQFKAVTNNEWFGDMGFLDFLQEFGPHFTINRMNTLDVVKRRLENNSPMTFLEYTYVMLQSVDFLKLHDLHGCTIQIGGSDQWGNIVNGVDLIRRVRGEEAFGITTTLLTNSAGEKMGKTAGGAVWLDPELTSPFDFFQFWRNIPDDKVGEFSLLFTDFSEDDIRSWDVNTAKERLAFEVTRDVHGMEAAEDALNKAKAMFINGEAGVEVTLSDGLTVVDLIVTEGWAESRSAARRLISGNAVSVNGQKITEDSAVAAKDVVRVGKKHSAKVV